MTQEPILDVLRLQRLAQQRILSQIKHSRAKIVARHPVGIHLPQLFGLKRLGVHIQRSGLFKNKR
jgi:hypothetical protein